MKAWVACFYEEAPILKKRMQEGDPNVACFYEDAEGTLWFKEKLIVPKKE
jgi:hypothetical protein